MNERLSIKKNIQSGSSNVPQCSPNQFCLLQVKSIPVPPWPNGTQGHSGLQHPSDILGFMVSPECESVASHIALNNPHYCYALLLYDWVLSFLLLALNSC